MESKSQRVHVFAAIIAAILAHASCAVASTLDDARARFNEREFDKAAALFEKATTSGPPSAGVYFELGRTYSELGDEARAALNFQRSLLLDARFAPARTALAKTETELGLPRRAPAWQTLVASRVPMDPLALAGTILFWLAAFLFLAGAFSKRKLGRFVGAFCLLLLAAILITTVFLCDPRITGRSAAMILTTGGATALSSPADQSEKVASLPQGSVIEILSQRGRWFYARLPGGAKGWVLTEGIVPLIPAS